MPYHVVLNRPTDLAGFTKEAQLGLSPRHSMAELSRLLDAKIHDGAGLTPSLSDILLGKLSRTSPLWWTIARSLRKKVVSGDVIFCTGEDIAAPVAALCGNMPQVGLAVMAHSVDSRKKRLALQAFRMKSRVDLFFTVAEPQAAFLREFLNLSSRRVKFVWDQTDTRFFTPGAASPKKTRPCIVSVGLERRDYTTLAKATSDLDIDVCISGFSSDTRSASRAFPDQLPANMTRRFYSWPDLLQLYRNADVVVVSLFPNSYAAGVQGLMEGLACGRPIVATETKGLEKYLKAPGKIVTVEPGNASGMRSAIIKLLEDHDERERLSERGAMLAAERHQLERYVNEIAASLRELAAGLDAPAK